MDDKKQITWLEKLEKISEEIGDIHEAEFDPNSASTALIQYLCVFTQKNIDLFVYSFHGGNSVYKNSYVDLMKTAIRRQIDVNQKATLPLIKKIDPIHNLWNYELKESFEEINKYWAEVLNFPSDAVQDMKKHTSDYVHPKLPLKIPNIWRIEDMVQRLYEDCGHNLKSLNFLLKKLNLTIEVEELIRQRVYQLLTDDVNVMIKFSDLFLQIIRIFNKNFIR